VRIKQRVETTGTVLKVPVHTFVCSPRTAERLFGRSCVSFCRLFLLSTRYPKWQTCFGCFHRYSRALAQMRLAPDQEGAQQLHTQRARADEAKNRADVGVYLRTIARQHIKGEANIADIEADVKRTFKTLHDGSKLAVHGFVQGHLRQGAREGERGGWLIREAHRRADEAQRRPCASVERFGHCPFEAGARGA
jgi:hypothetical protein